MTQILVFLSLFSTSFYVSYSLYTQNTEPFSLVASFGTSVSVFLVRYSSFRVWQHVRNLTLLFATAVSAWVANVFSEYCIAFVSTPLILIWIQIIDAEGLVKYPISGASFLLTRCVMWASLVAMSVALGSTFENPVLTVTLPFFIACIETLGMLFTSSMVKSYDFSPDSIYLYVALKSSIFLVVPVLIQKSSSSPPWWD